MKGTKQKTNILAILWVVLFFIFFAWSAIEPYDPVIWALEVLPAALGIIILAATWNKFRLTPITYWLILLHAIILMIGGHYTYEKVAFFEWLKNYFGFARNNYDKVGHFMQGFVPAIIAREILIRKTPLKKGGWLFTMVICVCLAVSALYEILEWVVAVTMGEAANAFLATQGYVWDTQSDMAWALIGSIIAQIFLSKTHDNQLLTFINQK